MSLLAAARLKSDPHFDVHPPLFLWMLRAWSRGGMSEAWLRLLSVLPSLLSLVMLWRLSDWWGLSRGQRRALLWMQALSFPGLQLAREVRMYSWLEFWCLLHLWALQERRGWATGVSLLAACYTHVFGLFLLPLGGRSLLRPRLVALALWIPWAFVHYRLQLSHPLDLRQLPGVLVLLEAVGRIGAGRLAAFGDRFSVLLGLLLILLLLVALRRRAHPQVVALALVPLGVAWLVSRYTPLNVFEFKYFYWTQSGWAALCLVALPRASAAVACCWGVWSAWGWLGLLLHPHDWLANWRGATELVRARPQVVVHPSMMSAPLLYYGVSLSAVDEWQQLVPGQDMTWIVTPHHPFVVRQGLKRGIQRYWSQVSRETLVSRVPSCEIEVVSYRWRGQSGAERSTRPEGQEVHL